MKKPFVYKTVSCNTITSSTKKKIRGPRVCCQQLWGVRAFDAIAGPVRASVLSHTYLVICKIVLDVFFSLAGKTIQRRSCVRGLTDARSIGHADLLRVPLLPSACGGPAVIALSPIATRGRGRTRRPTPHYPDKRVVASSSLNVTLGHWRTGIIRDFSGFGAFSLQGIK